MAAVGVMAKCNACGASLEASASECEYCGSTTPFAHLEAGRAAAVAEGLAAIEDEALEETAKRAALIGLVCGILSVVICCVPTAPVAIIMGRRASRLYREAGRPSSNTAVIATALGVVGLVLGIGLITFWRYDTGKLEERRAAAAARLGDRAVAETLDAELACDIARVRLLADGTNAGTKKKTRAQKKADKDDPTVLRAVSALAVKSVDCPGKLKLDGDRARLDLIEVHTSTKLIDAAGCFSRSGRWHVTSFVPAGQPCPNGSAPAPNAPNAPNGAPTPPTPNAPNTPSR